MSLDLLRLIIDSGLLILIWMVQLIAYPSFKYFEKTNLEKWHLEYTKRITLIVMPLMVGQVILAGLQCIRSIEFYSGISMLLIVIVWAITFMIFVPLHNKIQNLEATREDISGLIKLNWWRTLIWTILFLATVLRID